MTASNAPSRLRALLAEPGLVVMPAVWDGLTAKLSAGAGFKTAFLSGSCVAASRLGGPDLDLHLLRRDVRLLQHGARRRARPAGAGRRRPRLRQRHERAAHRARLWPRRRRRRADRGQDHAARAHRRRQALPAARGGAHEDPRRRRGGQGVRHPDPGAHRLPADPGHRRGGGAHRDVCRGRRRHPVPRLARPTTARSAAPSPPPRAGRPSPCCRPARRAPRRRRSEAAAARLQDRHLSDRHAVAGRGRHEGRAGGAEGRRGGGQERAAAAGAARDPGLCRLRRRRPSRSS